MSSPPKSEQRKSESLQVRIEHAVGRLKSLHDGDSGFLEVVELGPDVVPALRRLLFEPEPSGLHQVRGRAAEALAALGAFDVLADFLRSRQPIADPVERLGEEVVTGVAARAIARLREEWVYRLLGDLAAHCCVAGVLAGFGSFHRKDSIEIFIRALSEDEVRLTAEAILRGFGRAVRPALIAAALDRGDAPNPESESHLRNRRSALGLLLEIGIPPKKLPVLRPLLEDSDRQIALLACRVCFDLGSAQEWARAIRRRLISDMARIGLSASGSMTCSRRSDPLLRVNRFEGSGSMKLKIRKTREPGRRDLRYCSQQRDASCF
jgi:HEAT repeat protein